MRKNTLKGGSLPPPPRVPTEPPEPDVLEPEVYERIDAALGQLAFARALIARLERVNIPCEEAKQDCEQLVQFLTGLKGSAEVPEHKGPLPSPFEHAQLARFEDAQRELGVAKRICQRCEKCGIKVDQIAADIDAAINFFQGLEMEFKGPGKPIGGNPLEVPVP